MFNLGVARGKYKVTDRAYFQIAVNQESVPELTNEAALVAAAKNIVSGEAARTAAGGEKMVNPAVEEVEAVLNEYLAALTEQSAKKDGYEKEQRDVDNIRGEALELVRDIWDEIEFTFRKDANQVLRRKAREYGVVYVTRPGEPEETEVTEESEA